MAVCVERIESELGTRTCSVEGCGRKISSRGYCQNHYNAIKRKLNPYFNIPKVKLVPMTCKGCNKEVLRDEKNVKKSKNFCSQKCLRISTHGDDRDRFYKNIEFNSNGCWDWKGNTYTDGYGQTYVNNKNMRTHRYSYELHVGKIPEGLWALHICDRHMCCNFSHIFIGTPKQNTQDMINKGRKPIQLGSQTSAAKLTEEQVKEIKLKLRNGEGVVKLSKYYCLTHSTIGAIKSGKTWSHIL